MKSRLLLPFLFVLPFLVHAQKGIRESCSPATPPVIDGRFDDWQSEWLVDPKGKFIYNVCNDESNLYLRLKVSDDLTQRKIGLFGLTVFLNPKGKKIGKMGMKYPVEKTEAELKKETGSGPLDAKKLEELKRKLVEDAEVLEFVGFSKQSVVSSRLGLMNGIQVFIMSDSAGDYVYEAKIPFKAFKIDKSAVKVLGVAFVTGKLTPPRGSQTAAPPGGYGNSQYGRGGYGGYGNRGYGGMGSNIQNYTPQRYSPFQSSTYMSVGIKLQ